MVMAREKFADDSNEAKAAAPEEKSIEKSLHEGGGKENEAKLPNEEICRQPCARWAGIVKKGRCKGPAPPGHGGCRKASMTEKVSRTRCRKRQMSTKVEK